MIDKHHRFKVGQIVEILPTILRGNISGRFEITRLVPCDSNDPRYRLMREDRKQERVISEGELILVAATDGPGE